MGQPHVDFSDDWVTFPGGELEGKKPKALCAACRDQLKRAATMRGTRSAQRRPGTLCFQCYRADLERQRAIRAAGELDTASDARFQSQLPFEPVNRPRLQMLKADRAEARTAMPAHDRSRRHAQIEARHALQRLAEGLKARGLSTIERERAMFEAVHAAELQLPEAWLPFVVSR